MNTRTLCTLLIAMIIGAACSTDKEQAMTMDDAQHASGKSTDEVRAADINGDQLIDAAEFAALTVAPEAGDATKGSGIPAGE